MPKGNLERRNMTQTKGASAQAKAIGSQQTAIVLWSLGSPTVRGCGRSGIL